MKVPSLKERSPHSNSEKSADGIRCHTSADQWSYALIFELPQEARSSNRRLLVSIKGEVEAGSIGLGVVKEDLSSYLVEEQFRPGDVDVSIFVAAARVQ